MAVCEVCRVEDEDERDCEVEAEVELEEGATKAVCEAPSVEVDAVGAAKDLETGY